MKIEIFKIKNSVVSIDILLNMKENFQISKKKILKAIKRNGDLRAMHLPMNSHLPTDIHLWMHRKEGKAGVGGGLGVGTGGVFFQLRLQVLHVLERVVLVRRGRVVQDGVELVGRNVVQGPVRVALGGQRHGLGVDTLR